MITNSWFLAKLLDKVVKLLLHPMSSFAGELGFIGMRVKGH